MSVWVTSLVSTTEVINNLLEKYKVDCQPNNFALFVVRDSGGNFQKKNKKILALIFYYLEYIFFLQNDEG